MAETNTFAGQQQAHQPAVAPASPQEPAQYHPDVAQQTQVQPADSAQQQPQTEHPPASQTADEQSPQTTQSQAKALGRLVRDRRRHQRVAISLEGRFMRADKQEYACRVINISPGGIAVQADVIGLPGERIVLYLEHMGRLEGDLARTFPGGFAVKLVGTPYKREKIANQLTWLVNKDRVNLSEDREHQRQIPFRNNMKLTMADGTEQTCKILDVSLGGASIAISPRPMIGVPVTLGLIRGTIIRHHDQGVGVRFLETQDPATIERQFS